VAAIAPAILAAAMGPEVSVAIAPEVSVAIAPAISVAAIALEVSAGIVPEIILPAIDPGVTWAGTGRETISGVIGRAAILAATDPVATSAAAIWPRTDPRRGPPTTRCAAMGAGDAPTSAAAMALSAVINQVVSPRRRVIAVAPASAVAAASAEVAASVAVAGVALVAVADAASAEGAAVGVAAAVDAVDKVQPRGFSASARNLTRCYEDSIPAGNGAMLKSRNPRAVATTPARLLLSVSAFLAMAWFSAASVFAESPAQRVFQTPQAAVKALLAAAKAGDPKAELGPILGPDAEKVISSGDSVADDNARKGFISKYQQMHRLGYDADGRVILYIGADNWPLPIPLVKKDNGWMFDTAAGEQELVYRRIGANELYTIDVLGNLVAAQDEYAAQQRDSTGVALYAQKILSDEGQRNGLYWRAQEGAPESPIGPLIAKAVSEGYKRGQAGQPIPFHGYIYRVLTAQGKDAPGGAKNYIRKGRMTGGFAFLAYPAEYRSSGVMTFLVGSNGVVLQKDLGPETAKLAQEITRYDPDHSWQEAEPEEAPPEETEAAAGQAQGETQTQSSSSGNAP